SSADVVEVLRPAVARAIAPAPLGEALGDARDDLVAPVAERHHREDAAADLLGRAAAQRGHAPAHRRVGLLGSRELALDLDTPDPAIRLALAVDVATFVRASVALDGARGRDPGVGPEVHREPPVVVRRLPVARPPRVVAEPVAVDRP